LIERKAGIAEGVLESLRSGAPPPVGLGLPTYRKLVAAGESLGRPDAAIEVVLGLLQFDPVSGTLASELPVWRTDEFRRAIFSNLFNRQLPQAVLASLDPIIKTLATYHPNKVNAEYLRSTLLWYSSLGYANIATWLAAAAMDEVPANYQPVMTCVITGNYDPDAWDKVHSYGENPVGKLLPYLRKLDPTQKKQLETNGWRMLETACRRHPGLLNNYHGRVSALEVALLMRPHAALGAVAIDIIGLRTWVKADSAEWWRAFFGTITAYAARHPEASSSGAGDQAILRIVKAVKQFYKEKSPWLVTNMQAALVEWLHPNLRQMAKSRTEKPATQPQEPSQV